MMADFANYWPRAWRREAELIAIGALVSWAGILPCSGGNTGMTAVRATFPEGAGGRSGVLLEKIYPREIVARQAFDYRLVVRNLTRNTLDDVVVSSAFPKHLRIDASAPPTQLTEGRLARWAIGALAAGAEQTIIVRVTPLSAGSITHCDDVTFRTRVSVCATLNVISPELHLDLNVPKLAALCEPIPVVVTASNVGTGPARDVTVSVVLPEGLGGPGGARSLSSRIAVLDQGQSQQIQVMLEAGMAGIFPVRASARNVTGAEAEASASVTVGQPVLELIKKAPSKAFVGRPVRVSLTVQNAGTYPARDLILQDVLSAGVELLEASDNATFVEGLLEWQLGELAVGASRTVTVSLRSLGQGVMRNEAVASAWCAARVAAAAQTQCVGVPAILLEVIDVEDPIEVGQKEAYVITATNQGTARDTNIVISCQLEETTRYLSSSGPTQGTLTGNVVTFAPLPALEPKASVSWRVNVQAVAVGDVRFGVQMTTDQLSRPVSETEATNFYGNLEE